MLVYKHLYLDVKGISHHLYMELIKDLTQM